MTKLFCLKVYELFNYCVGFPDNDSGQYKVMNEQGQRLVQAHADKQKKVVILKFD